MVQTLPDPGNRDWEGGGIGVYDQQFIFNDTGPAVASLMAPLLDWLAIRGASYPVLLNNAALGWVGPGRLNVGECSTFTCLLH